MKKTMLAVCFMVMTLTAVGAENTNSEQTAEVKVTATVVEPLVLTAKEVKFGKVAKGSKQNAPIENGEIVIKGQADEKVKIQFSDGMTENWKDTIREVTVALKSKTNSNSTTLTYSPELDPELGQPLALESGEKKIALRGNLVVPENAESGDYEGTLKVKVWYE